MPSAWADNPAVSGLTGQKIVKIIHVGAGSRLEGMRVSDVPWPDGCRVVLVARASSELIPTGDMRIEALDELLMIMDSEAEDDVTMKLNLMTRPSLK